MTESRQKRLLFARHGETEWNNSFRYQGRSDIPLNETGREQARRLARRIAAWKPEVIVASPLDRALTTARLLQEACGDNVTLLVRDGLAEIHFGEWEGLSVFEVRELYGSLYRQWRDDPVGVVPPGGEPFEDVLRRVGDVMHEFLESPFSRICFVCHGGSIRAAVTALLELPSSFAWRMRLDNCGLVGLDVWGDHVMLGFLNDALHVRTGDEILLPIPE
jgi:alpha-ribazole phosphatase/probable phosphoglycerate mutase